MLGLVLAYSKGWAALVLSLLGAGFFYLQKNLQKSKDKNEIFAFYFNNLLNNQQKPKLK